MMSERYIQMLDKAGFCSLFWEKWKTGQFVRHEDAYEALEIEYVDFFGCRKYKDFKSFRRRRDK
jgi:hypothetical protein